MQVCFIYIQVLNLQAQPAQMELWSLALSPLELPSHPARPLRSLLY
jgi:hypothetical protein